MFCRCSQFNLVPFFQLDFMVASGLLRCKLLCRTLKLFAKFQFVNFNHVKPLSFSSIYIFLASVCFSAPIFAYIHKNANEKKNDYIYGRRIYVHPISLFHSNWQCVFTCHYLISCFPDCFAYAYLMCNIVYLITHAHTIFHTIIDVIIKAYALR